MKMLVMKTNTEKTDEQDKTVRVFEISLVCMKNLWWKGFVPA